MRRGTRAPVRIEAQQGGGQEAGPGGATANGEAKALSNGTTHAAGSAQDECRRLAVCDRRRGLRSETAVCARFLSTARLRVNSWLVCVAPRPTVHLQQRVRPLRDADVDSLSSWRATNETHTRSSRMQGRHGRRSSETRCRALTQRDARYLLCSPAPDSVHALCSLTLLLPLTHHGRSSAARIQRRFRGRTARGTR